MKNINEARVFRIIFILGLISLLFFQYYNLIIYRYYSPPGDDPMGHYLMAKGLADHNFFDVLKNGSYPPLYHLVIFNISKALNADLLKVILWTYPIFIVFASLSIYFCAKLLFGRIAGLISFLLYGLAANSNIQLQNDGGYPNLIATHIFLPVMLLLILLFLKENRMKLKIMYCCFLTILFFLVISTHHFTTLTLLAVIFLSLPAVIAYSWITKKWETKKGLIFIGGYVLAIVFLFILFFKTELFASARNLAGFAMIDFLPHFPYFEFKNVGSGKPWLIDIYPQMIGTPLIWFGAAGFALLPFLYSKKLNQCFLPVIILVIWGLFYFLSSRQSFIVEPSRLARDLVVPLSISAGGIIGNFLNIAKKKHQVLFYICTVIMMIAFYPAFLERARGVDKLNPMVRMTDADMQAVHYLSSQSGSNVLVFGFNIYLSKFLPNWNIVSYDPDMTPEIIGSYDYLYVIDKQLGWLPEGTPVGLPEKVKNDDNVFLSYEKSFESPINRVEIYKVNKPVIAPKINTKKAPVKKPKTRQLN